MDLSKLSNSDKLIGLGAVVGVVAAFLPWYSVSAGILGSFSVNGFSSWLILSFIAAVLSLLMVALPLFGVALPKFGIENTVIQMILGAVVGGVPVLGLLTGMSSGGGVSGMGAGPSIGLFGAIAGGAIMLFGAFTAKGGANPAGPTQTPPSEPQA